jgi:hypothetical protein
MALQKKTGRSPPGSTSSSKDGLQSDALLSPMQQDEKKEDKKQANLKRVVKKKKTSIPIRSLKI